RGAVPPEVSNGLIDATSKRVSGSTGGPGGVGNCPTASAAASMAPVAIGTTSDNTAAAASTTRFDSVRLDPIRLERIDSTRALMSAPPTPATLMNGAST